MNRKPVQILDSIAQRLLGAYFLESGESLAPFGTTLPDLLDFPTGVEESFSLPCFNLRTPDSKGWATKVNSVSSLKREAERLLSAPLRINKRTIASAPSILAKNFASSFLSILGSNNKVEDTSSQIREQNKEGYSLSRDVYTNCIVTRFFTLSFDENYSSVDKYPKTVSLPLIFEAIVDVRIPGTKRDILRLRAPGAITGSFKSSTSRLQNVQIQIDTGAVLDCIVKSCRDLLRMTSIVTPISNFKASVTAANINNNDSMLPPPSRSSRKTVKFQSERDKLSNKRKRVEQSICFRCTKSMRVFHATASA